MRPNPTNFLPMWDMERAVRGSKVGGHFLVPFRKCGLIACSISHKFCEIWMHLYIILKVDKGIL